MKVIRKSENVISCECGSILEFTGQDLRQGVSSFYIECPICGKMYLIPENDETKRMYDQYHNAWNIE